jgi:hypothetical protein
MRKQVLIVETNPQPGPKAPIAGCTVSLKFNQTSSMIARYETMRMPRPIEIKSGRVTICARAGSAEASTLVLEAPRPGSANEGGDDESIIEIISLTPHAHVILIAARELGARLETKAQFSTAIGSNLRLLALGGRWHVASAYGVTLS